MPTLPLRWIAPPGRPNLRVLTDEEGQRKYVILQLDVQDDIRRAAPGQWLRGYANFGVFTTSKGKEENLMPTMSLTGGHGEVIARVALPPEMWQFFAGMTLPPLAEPDRTIVFPPLPDVPLW
jgi:hypothetical protein